MKLPLLLHYKPSVGVGPTVMLAQGKWRFEGNHKDSHLGVVLGDLVPVSLGSHWEYELKEDTPTKIEIFDKGSEPQLTVWAIRL